MCWKTPLWDVKMHVWDVFEPDLWQERIKKNFEDLPKQIEKIKTQQALRGVQILQQKAL